MAAEIKPIVVQTDGIQKVLVVDRSGNPQTIDVEEELAVNSKNYREEYLNQPVKYSRWSNYLTLVNRQVNYAQDQLDRTHAKMYSLVYNNLCKQNPSRRPTKDMVESNILQQEQYQEAQNELNDRKFEAEQIKYIVKAFEQRRDMLIQFGAEMRKDLEQQGA